MGSLSLKLDDPEIIWRVGEGSWRRAGWHISWPVSFERRWENVEVVGQGNLREMPGYLSVRVGELDPEPETDEDTELLSFERGGKPIGTLTFIPAYAGSSDGVVEASPNSYEATILVSDAELAALIAKVIAGHGPSRVWLSVPRFKLGVLPDGSDQTWHIDQRQWTKIDGANFVFTEEARKVEEVVAKIEPEPERPSDEALAITALRGELARGITWLMLALAAILFTLLVVASRMPSQSL